MNEQLPEKKRKFDGFYDIHSIFQTIQGEGPFAGLPAVFIRLAGCNLQCPLCDTEYTKDRTTWSAKAITKNVCILAGEKRGLVVITGGEPFRQDLKQLFEELIEYGFFIQVETNGTLPPTDFKYMLMPDVRYGVYIVCSPKTGSVHHDIEKNACCYKYVLSHGDVADDGLPRSVLEHPVKSAVARPPEWYRRPIYVQPADMKDEAKNKLNLEVAMASCLAYGYTLQLQIHKLIGVP